ncbi:MAG: phenylacetate--CoA ligase [Armatimonadetes bacterium CG07_land_8_20_14_0_80_40_9]|nr:MAG: phenylacetate--CoA ligase [Armatimonadetes bacterium CG07_land_8_20_14_0_80_40_9]
MTAWDKMSRQEIKKMQDKKLRDFIRYQVYPYSPYYHRLFDEKKIKPEDIKTTDDLRRLPFTSKADIAPSAESPLRSREFILQPDLEKIKKFASKKTLLKLLFQKIIFGEDEVRKRLEWEYRPVHIHFTTGRTAMPTPFLYSQRDLENLKEAGRRVLALGRTTPDAIGVNIFPYAPHLAFWQTFFGNLAVGATALHTGGGKILGTQNIINAIEQMKATGILGIPGYVYHLLREAASQKRDFSSVERILTGGERMSEGLRQKIKELLVQMGVNPDNLLVGSSYAFTEGRLAWIECARGMKEKRSYGYHLYPDLEFIEIINPKTGERVGEKEEGEIVYTPLDWRGTVVLRYRTGDIAVGGITYELCPNCGRTAPRISAEIKRSSEYKEFNLTKIKGTLVDLNAFFPLLMGHPEVVEWQVEIRKKDNDPFGLDELWLYVTAKEGVDQENLRKDLEKKILAQTEIAPNKIVFLPLGETLNKLAMETSLKELRIVDARPKTESPQ